MTFDEIVKEAMALTDEQKLDLVELLTVSVDPASLERTDLSTAWLEEIERRIDDIDAGRTSGRPIEEVMREIRAKLERQNL